MAEPTAEDQLLIEQAQHGSADAFAQLVRRYQNRLYRAMVAYTGDETDALDVVQDAFVLAFRRLKTFRGESAFFTWLYRIAVNASVDMHRRRRRRNVSLDNLRERIGHEAVDENPHAAPSHGMETADTQRLVRIALQKLPEEFRQALVLKEIEGLRYDEIAEIIGHPIGTVRSRLHRARAQLKTILEELLDSDTLPS